MAKKKRKKRPLRLPRSPIAPLSYPQLNLLLKQLMAPARAEYNRATAAREGLGAAHARIAEGVAPEVQKAYADAAQFSRSAAEGFSTGLRERANELGLEGGEADVVFGTSGFIPSEALNREGAAFTSAAAQLPSTVMGQTGQEVTSMRSAGARDLAAKRAELLNTLLERELQKRSIGIQAGYLNLGNRELAADTALGFAGLAAKNAGTGNKAKQERQERAAKAKKEKQAYWGQQNDKALQIALGWPARPDGRPEYDPRNAYDRLWNAVGTRLRQRGFKKATINKALRSVLLAAGYSAADTAFLIDIGYDKPVG